MKVEDVHTWNAIFAEADVRFDARNGQQLVCKRGYYKNCCVLKLQKRSWTNDRMDQVENQSGIFFSMWCDETSLRKNKILYNIHALKLRKLSGYTITSRDFASEFRERFLALRGDWPNAQVDYGPATLMQGWIASESDALVDDILVMMERFVRLSPIIDDLLESRRT